MWAGAAAAAEFEDRCYDDRKSILFGLRDAAPLNGPASHEGEADYGSSLSHLVGCFRAAQKRAVDRHDAGAWSEDKELRKKRWLALGVPAALIIPTLAVLSFEKDESAEAEEVEFTEDDDGTWMPSYDAVTDVLVPVDPCCELVLANLLDRHKALVLKPTRGCNSVGLLCLSIEASEPLRHVPQASGEQRIQPTMPPQLSSGSLWTFAPSKDVGTLESVRAVRRSDALRELILTRSAEMFKSGGPRDRALIVEELLSYDQEVSVLAVNGGNVQVLAGRTNCMERLLMLHGHETFVASSDFSPPSCRKHVLSTLARERHTAMMLQQKVAGDPAGRCLHEVIRSTVLSVANATGSSAFRVDFFVRWGREGMEAVEHVDGAPRQGAAEAEASCGSGTTAASSRRPHTARAEWATLHLNEVEHGFSAGSMLGWFGMPLTDYAMRSWCLRGDPSQQRQFIRKALGAATAAATATSVATAAASVATATAVAGAPSPTEAAITVAAAAAAAAAAAVTAAAAVAVAATATTAAATAAAAAADSAPLEALEGPPEGAMEGLDRGREDARKAADGHAQGHATSSVDSPALGTWTQGWATPWAVEHGAHMFSRIPSAALAIPHSAWLQQRVGQGGTEELVASAPV